MRFPALLLLLATSAWCADALPRLSNRLLEVTADPAAGTLRVTDKRAKVTWEQRATRAAIQWKSVIRRGDELVFTNDACHAELALDKRAAEFEATLTCNGPLKSMAAFPAPFVTEAGTSLVVPMNEGILYPVDDASIGPRSLIAYGGHGISMPWFGVFAQNTGAGMIAIIETPDDARIDINRFPKSTLYIQPLWENSRQDFRYPRKIRYAFFEHGGYVAQAKRYRAYAQQTGLFKTLAQKRKENPNVDMLVGAANIWNWDKDKVGLVKEMQAAGFDRILWSGGGSGEQIEQMNKLGVLTGRYEIFQDVWAPEAPGGLPHDGWPEALVWLPNGDWMKGWAHHRTNPDGTKTIFEGGVISSPRQLEFARRKVPEDLKTHPFKARFIDTTTASPWREDYNPAHPLSRSEDRKYKMALLEFISKDMKMVTGTETGIDPSVPYVHYYEGMLSLGPYRLPDAGREMIKYKAPTPDFLKFQVGHVYRVPLWELVYHECVVSQWYWGDYNNKAPEVWDRRDLFNLLYATPPMYMFDTATWRAQKDRFAASYKGLAPTVRKLGYDEMVSHEFLSSDHAVQRTHWKSGAEITVDFNKMTSSVK